MYHIAQDSEDQEYIIINDINSGSSGWSTSLRDICATIDSRTWNSNWDTTTTAIEDEIYPSMQIILSTYTKPTLDYLQAFYPELLI